MKPAKSIQPYQPFLLRTLHGITGLCLIMAILTAFWTYDVYDGRWGRVSLPAYRTIEGIHGTFGLWTLLIFPAFVVYAFRRGQKRLIQANSLTKLAQIGSPIGWYTVNRIVNTLALMALTLALFSGKMMDETWLPKGELTHRWYYVHLVSWLMMVGVIALHLLINAKVGGAPLLLSMLHWRHRDKDSPALWPNQVGAWWPSFWQNPWVNWWQSRSPLIALETAILVTLFAAWVIPALKP